MGSEGGTAASSGGFASSPSEPSASSHVRPVDVLLALGWLAPTHLEQWREGRVASLERVVQASLGKVFTAVAELGRWARQQGADDEIRGTGQTRLWWRDEELDTPLDVFLPQHPTYHQIVVERATPIDVLGVGMKVLSTTDLMVFKMLYDRTKDWADIEGLLESGAGDPDDAAQWITEFVGADDPRLARLHQLVGTIRRPLQPVVTHQSGAEPSVCIAWIPEAGKHCVLAARHYGAHQVCQPR